MLFERPNETNDSNTATCLNDLNLLKLSTVNAHGYTVCILIFTCMIQAMFKGNKLKFTNIICRKNVQMLVYYRSVESFFSSSSISTIWGRNSDAQ